MTGRESETGCRGTAGIVKGIKENRTEELEENKERKTRGKGAEN